MITIERLIEIEDEVKNTLFSAFQDIAKNNFENYIPFILDGEYDEVIGNNDKCGLSPYTIEYSLDNYKDENRLRFMCEFLNEFYNFSDKISIKYNSYRINIETMIYAHIWEAKPFLKNLYRLTMLLNGKEYEWKVKDTLFYVKANFINDHIIKQLSSIDSPLTYIFQNSYDNVLRNALAHNDYTIDSTHIEYINDRAKESEQKFFKKTITEWAECFIYSFNLSYWFMKIKEGMKRHLAGGMGNNYIEIKVFDRKGNPRKISVKYDSDSKSFRFV